MPQIIMGFDYGQRRIGVAVAQTLTGHARALRTLNAVKDKPDWDAIEALVGDWSPHQLVVGLPLNQDGSEHTVTAAARRFGNRLAHRCRLPINWIDERLSSHAAAARLAVAKPGKGPRKQALDAEAACVILETWLSENS